MEATDCVIYQGEFYKLNESRKRLIGTKLDTWKLKYLIFRHKGEKPVLEYHRKKPKSGRKLERTVTDTFELWPSYKVEKLQNARGREFVCEVTSTDFHIFLSADSSKEIDVLVFLLQVQIKLKENITNDLISVVPDDSECQHRIGAKGSNCVLHASPWGLTLALEQTRALLAQWPLKSIRYYETSGAGKFSIEAGRVAPMGEGLFSFKTQTGEDDYMYDLVDSYIVNTLDRVKPTQKGTPEEIEDYIREHDCLHSLTAVYLCSHQVSEIRDILRKNWNITLSASGDATSASSSESHSPSLRHHQSRGQAAGSSASSSHRPTQSSSLVINLERPGESSDNQRNSSSRHAVSTSDFCIADRPPPLPSRSASSSGVPRRSQRREHSIPRKVDVTSTKSGRGAQSAFSEDTAVSSSSQRPNSNPSSVIQKGRDNDAVQVCNVNLTENSSTSHHTEFYNMSSSNMKVRVSKSPVITKNPNKVGRAEYLLSMQQSGIRSPVLSNEKWDSSGGEEDHREAAEYLDAVSRASHLKYGRNSSIDQSQLRLRRDLSSSNQSGISDYSCMESPGVSSRLGYGNGYVNLQNSFGGEVHHSHQRSAPEPMYEVFAPHDSNRTPRDDNQTLSPPILRHQRQISADELDHASARHFSEVSMSEGHPRSSGMSARSGESSRQVSVGTSRTDNRTSDCVQDLDVIERQNANRQLSSFSGLEVVDGNVSEWLMSASCEDLSDHMRTVIYDDSANNDDAHQHEDFIGDVDSSRKKENHQPVSSSSSGFVSSSDKPPLPFTGLKKFHDHTGTVAYSRDRSKSFGYMNIPVTADSAQTKTQSSAPSAHLIRKMVNVRAKQETLRKSLSNPNFLNLGSKEHLCNLKAAGGSTTKLATQTKQKSKSFGSLFPAIKKALSRDSLGHSRSTTPERRSSRSTTPERRSSFSFRRRNSDADSNFKREATFHSYGELTIQGIRMSERSRSFRRVRGAKSVEVLSKTEDDNEPGKLSSATTASSPSAATLEKPDLTSDSNRTSAASSNAVLSSEGTSVVIPSSVASDLPPVPAPVQSGPAFVPRKIVAEDKSPLNSHTKVFTSVSSSHYDDSQPYQNSDTVRSDQQNKTQNQLKLQRSVVSDNAAELEKRTSDKMSRPSRQHRSQRTSSSSVSSDVKTTNMRISRHQEGEAQGNKTSSSRQRTTNSQINTAADSRQADSERAYHASVYKDPGSSSSGQGSQLIDKKHNSISQGDDINPKPGESKPKLPSPFQPIPFKKQSNGIRSVQAPSKPLS